MAVHLLFDRWLAVALQQSVAAVRQYRAVVP